MALDEPLGVVGLDEGGGRLAEVIDVPVTVTLTYGSGETESLVIPVTERVVERVVPLKGALRNVSVNDDHAALVEIDHARES